MARVYNQNMASTVDYISKTIITKFKPRDKTPYSLLLEISIRSNVVFKYETKKYLYTNKNPLFQVSMKFGNLESVFTTSNKQNSKHGAAAEILKKLETDIHTKAPNAAEMIKDVTSKFIINNETISDENSSLENVDDNACVTLMQLNQICQKRGLQKLPEFKFDPMVGPSHNPNFTCHVQQGLLKVSGTGKSKKAAKYQAALKLLYELKDEEEISKSVSSLSSPSLTPEQSPKDFILKTSEDNKNNIASSASDNQSLCNNYNDRFFASTPIVPNSNTDINVVFEQLEKINLNENLDDLLNNIKLSDFEPLRGSFQDCSFETFRNVNRPFIKKLLSGPLIFEKKTNYVVNLDLLSRELKFDVQYRHSRYQHPAIPDLNCACVASISTDPLYIMMAYGSSAEDAKQNVSFCIMFAIKTICSEM